MSSISQDPKPGSRDTKSTPAHVPHAGPAPAPCPAPGANGLAADRAKPPPAPAAPTTIGPDFSEAYAVLGTMTTAQLVAARRMAAGLDPDSTGTTTRFSPEFRSQLRLLFERLLAIFRRLLSLFRVQLGSEFQGHQFDDAELDNRAQQEMAKAIDEILESRATTPRGQNEIERDARFHEADLKSLDAAENEYRSREVMFTEMPEYLASSENLSAAKKKLASLEENPPSGLLSALRRPEWQREVNAHKQSVFDLEISHAEVTKQAKIDAAKKFKNKQSSETNEYLKRLQLQRTLLLQQIGRLSSELASLKAQIARTQANQPDSPDSHQQASENDTNTETEPLRRRDRGG